MSGPPVSGGPIEFPLGGVARFWHLARAVRPSTGRPCRAEAQGRGVSRYPAPAGPAAPGKVALALQSRHRCVAVSNACSHRSPHAEHNRIAVQAARRSIFCGFGAPRHFCECLLRRKACFVLSRPAVRASVSSVERLVPRWISGWPGNRHRKLHLSLQTTSGTADRGQGRTPIGGSEVKWGFTASRP